MSPARVAVVMRTKDRPLLLRRALLDVLAQSFLDWRLVVVNDGGDRAALEAVLAAVLPERDDRIQVIHNETGVGMEAAANLGVSTGESDYLVIHDDDDTWHPQFLERTVAHLDAHADDIAVAVRTEIILERIDGDAVVETGREIFWANLTDLTLVDLLRINRAVPISLLYRRAVHDWIGPFRADLAAVGDWEFNLRLVQAGHVAFLAGEPLAFWHQRRDQDGVLGNSMYAAGAEHVRSDLLVREGALQAYAKEHGIGLPLYVAHVVNTRADELHDQLGRLTDLVERQDRRLAELEALVGDKSLLALARRRYRRVKDRLTTDAPD